MTVTQTATVVLPAGRLTASAVDTTRRTIEGILVPWDEVGQPAIDGAGRRVSVRRGGLQLAAAVTGIDTHARPTREVSHLVAHEVRDAGIWGRLHVDATPAGDELLTRVAAGERLGLSVEARNLLLDPTVDEVIGGTVDLVAHVDTPAFTSARVHAMTAALAEVTTTAGGTTHVTAPTTTVEPVAPAAPPAAPAFDYAQLAAALAPMLTTPTAPAGLPTGGLVLPTGAPATPATPAEPAVDPVVRAATLQAQYYADPSNGELRAALSDITQASLPLFDNPSTLGEKLWEGAGYARRFVGLFRQKPLTAMKGTGWQWVERPRVDDWAGNKTPIPSNTVSVEEVPWSAERCAGGWDIDRKFRDFGDAEFWTEFYAAQTESYLELSDERAAAALVEYAFDVTDAASYPTRYTLPAGYSTSAGGLVVAQPDVLQAAALATAILEDTPRVRRGPDYIVMNTADWLSLSTLTNLDLPAFLALLKVDPGNFQRSSAVPPGSIIAGVQQAATFRELGSVPIRVEALDVARGGVDSAVYGYTATSLDRPGGIISVPLAVTAPASNGS